MNVLCCQCHDAVEQEVPGVWPGRELGHHQGEGCGPVAPARGRGRGLGRGGLQWSLSGQSWVLGWEGSSQRKQLQYLCLLLLGQELFLRGDKCYRDKESEAGEMPGGALFLLLMITSHHLLFILSETIQTAFNGSDEKLWNVCYLAAVVVFQVPSNGRMCKTDRDCERGAWDQQSHGTDTGLLTSTTTSSPPSVGLSVCLSVCLLVCLLVCWSVGLFHGSGFKRV